MTAATRRPRTRHGLVFHASAVAVALVLLPWVHGALHVAGEGHLPSGHGYALAWALAGVAWLLYRWTGWWPAWTAIWAMLLGGITDLPVLHTTVTYLTGAVW